jgi:Outer membrane protein beta-barrel domain
MSFGGSVGLNISNASFSPDLPASISKSSRTGFRISGIMDIGFVPMFALQIEPTYATGGVQETGPLFQDQLGQVVNGTITTKTSYIQIPILLNLKIPVTGPVSPYIVAGPDISFILSAKETDEPNGYPSSEGDVKDQLKSLNFALDFGAGIGYKLVPTTTLTFDVRYSLGLSDIASDTYKQQVGNQSIKTTGFQLIAGVMVGL